MADTYTSIPKEGDPGFVLLGRLAASAFLVLQLVMTVGIADAFEGLSQQELLGKAWMLPWSMFLCLACSILVCVTSLVRKSLMSRRASRLILRPMNYVMVALFTRAEGVMLGLVAACFTPTPTGGCIAVGALILLVRRSIYVWTTDMDYVHRPLLCALNISKDQSRIQLFVCVCVWMYVYAWTQKSSPVYACCSILAFVNHGLHHYLCHLRHADDAR